MSNTGTKIPDARLSQKTEKITKTNGIFIPKICIYLSIYLIYSEQKVSNFTSEQASDALQLSCTYLPVCEVRTRKTIILQKVGDISLPKFLITGNNKVLTSELTAINIRD